jgi:hypothetical protein
MQHHERKSLPMCRQPDVGCEHKPKRIITHEWNIYKYSDEREKRHNERNYVYAENVENTDSRNTHIANLQKASQDWAFYRFLKIENKNISLMIFIHDNVFPNQRYID